MGKQGNSKKIYFGIVLIVVVVILGYIMQLPKVSSEEKVATQFLTQIYQVENHERYLNLNKKMDEFRKTLATSGKPLSGIVTIPEEIFQEYIDLYKPIMTEKCYEVLFANVDYGYADRFAAENGYLFKVKKIELKETAEVPEVKQYAYTAEVEAILEKDNKSETIVVEGNIGIEKDADGVLHIASFKKAVHNEYDKLVK